MPIVNIQVTREGTKPGATSVTAEEKAALENRRRDFMAAARYLDLLS